jgi:hypothetical protein
MASAASKAGRRWSAAMAAAVVAHAALAAALSHHGARPVDASPLTEVRILSLGEGAGALPPVHAPAPTPPRAHRESASVSPRPRRASAPATSAPATIREPEAARIAHQEQGASADAGSPSPSTASREDGPRGPHLTVLVRLDRLRDKPYAAFVTDLLARLPDCRALVQGTGLRLQDSFDTLWIATPNPSDVELTSLVARHRTSDLLMRGALDQGTTSRDETLTWGFEEGHPYALRRAGAAAAPRSEGERVVALADQGVLLVTPPPERHLLIAGTPAAPVISDAGVPSSPAPGWRLLIDYMEAEEDELPADAFAMLTEVDLLTPATLQGVPWTSGLPMPHLVRATVTSDARPVFDLRADFASDQEGLAWETAWPTGAGAAGRAHDHGTGALEAWLTRASFTRTGSTIHLRWILEAAELYLIARAGMGAPLPAPK